MAPGAHTSLVASSRQTQAEYGSPRHSTWSRGRHVTQTGSVRVFLYDFIKSLFLFGHKLLKYKLKATSSHFSAMRSKPTLGEKILMFREKL